MRGISRTGGQEGNQPQQVIALGNQAIQTALADAQLFKEHVLFFVIHLRDIFFDFCGDDQNLAFSLAAIALTSVMPGMLSSSLPRSSS